MVLTHLRVLLHLVNYKILTVYLGVFKSWLPLFFCGSNSRFTNELSVIRPSCNFRDGRVVKIYINKIVCISLVFLWLGGMHFHGAYFSNYDICIKDEKYYSRCSQIVFSVVHQEILNMDVSEYYFQGLRITSGLFQLWRSEGIITCVHLKFACAAALSFTIITLAGAYFHMHISWPSLSFYKKFKCLSIHHLALLLGLGSISFAGHQYHIAGPINRLLDASVDPGLICSPQDLLFQDLMSGVLGGTSGKLGLNPVTGYVSLGTLCSHHLYVGIVFILGGIIGLLVRTPVSSISTGQVGLINSFHGDLSISLAIAGSLSITFAHHQNAIPIYFLLGSDYTTTLCLFTHHMWIGGFLIVGAGAHASLYMISSYYSMGATGAWVEILKSRDIIVSHLIWVISPLEVKF